MVPNAPRTSAGASGLGSQVSCCGGPPISPKTMTARALPARAALLAAHPDLAERLIAFFVDFDRLDRQAGDLRLSREATGPAVPAATDGELPRVRYFGD
jgi:hypothetical protein